MRAQRGNPQIVYIEPYGIVTAGSLTMTQSTMPLYYLLIPYSLIILAFLVFAIIDLLHIVLHSEINKTSVFVTLVFLVGFFASLFGSYIKLSEINWNAPLLSIGTSNTTNLFK